MTNIFDKVLRRFRAIFKVNTKAKVNIILSWALPAIDWTACLDVEGCAYYV